MATVPIDTSELENLKFCSDKLREIAEIMQEQGEEMSAEEKLQEIKRIIRGR